MADFSTHPSDDDLVLLFYGELPEAEAAGLRSHVAACEPCRASYNTLTRTLHLVNSSPAPDPGADFEARVWARVASGIRPARGLATSWWRLGALAASLLFVAGALWMWTPRQSIQDAHVPRVESAASTTSDVYTRERVLLAAVDAHLVQTEMLFVELLNAPADEAGAFSHARSTADDLVASGRLFRETALGTGASQLVSVLDELEPVLVEMARSGDEPDPRDISALLGRIEQDDLLFKVRAVAADIQERQGWTVSGEGAL
jgi:hypothetical protein